MSTGTSVPPPATRQGWPRASGNTWHCGANGCPSHSDPTHVCTGRSFSCNRRAPACPTLGNRSDRCASGTSWDCGARNCPGHGSTTETCSVFANWQAIPDGALAVHAHPSQRGAKQIVVNFSGMTLVPTATRQVDLRLTVKEMGPSFPLGWGGGSKYIYLCTGALRDINASANWNPMQ